MAYLEENLPYIDSDVWTPVLTCSTSNPTVSYTRQNGIWTRVGNLLICSADVILSSLSGGSGAVRISLPFSNAGSGPSYGICNINGVTFTGNYINAAATSGNAFAAFNIMTDNAASAVLLVGGLSSTARLNFNVAYEV